MNVAIVGSRDYPDLAAVREYVHGLTGGPFSTVISGGARGVDSAAEEAARDMYLDTRIFPADWDNLDVPGAVVKTRRDGTKYNAVAGFQRNQTIVDNADKVVAFWDGKSGGTRDTLKRAHKARVHTEIIYP